MVRRLLFTVALLAATAIGVTGCHPGGSCHIVFLNGPDNHPPGWVYVAGIQQWHTWAGGVFVVKGYSRTYDTVIWDHLYCTDSLPFGIPDILPI